MKLSRFAPPALLEDFQYETQKDDWSTEVSGYFDEGVQFNERFYGKQQSQFYHPVTTDTATPNDEALIDWPAFPKLVKDAFPDDEEKAWSTAEGAPDASAADRAQARVDYQDEYLEWHVVRDASNKITRVSFTCETQQYYQFLAQTDTQKLVELYDGLVDPAFRGQVKIEHLVSHGTYDAANQWNTLHGAVHLRQPNNNLYAEVQIAAQACVLRALPNGTSITDPDRLIRCARYGAPGRASDPKIGAIVNAKAREGYSITLRDPVALYITQWGSAGWKKPDGSPVDNYWKLLRGKPAAVQDGPAMGLHLVYEVPPEEGFVVGDIKIGNRPIEYGGQLAENIHVGLFAVLCRAGQSHHGQFGCDNKSVGAHPNALAHAHVLEVSRAGLLPLRGTSTSTR